MQQGTDNNKKYFLSILDNQGIPDIRKVVTLAEAGISQVQSGEYRLKDFLSANHLIFGCTRKLSASAFENIRTRVFEYNVNFDEVIFDTLYSLNNSDKTPYLVPVTCKVTLDQAIFTYGEDFIVARLERSYAKNDRGEFEERWVKAFEVKITARDMVERYPYSLKRCMGLIRTAVERRQREFARSCELSSSTCLTDRLPDIDEIIRLSSLLPTPPSVGKIYYRIYSPSTIGVREMSMLIDEIMEGYEITCNKYK